MPRQSFVPALVTNLICTPPCPVASAVLPAVVTVTTAGNTADATGQGSVQVKFVTKSGTNELHGTAYEYYRADWLNANDWFRNRDLPPDPATGNAPKPALRNYQQGVAIGGPINRNKAFFFFNYEEQRAPSSSTLQRVVLTPEASGDSTMRCSVLELGARCSS